MALRPVGQEVWSRSTSTGLSTWAYFGVGHRYLTAYIANPSTNTFVASVEVSASRSTAVVTILAAATSTGANGSRTSTGGIVFDKARINVSGNATTGAVTVHLVAGA